MLLAGPIVLLRGGTAVNVSSPGFGDLQEGISPIRRTVQGSPFLRSRI